MPLNYRMILEGHQDAATREKEASKRACCDCAEDLCAEDLNDSSADARETAKRPLHATRPQSSPALTVLWKQELAASGGSRPLKKRMKRSESEFVLNHLAPSPEEGTTRSDQSVKPDQHLQSLFKGWGQSMTLSGDRSDSFLPISKQHQMSYPQVSLAARQENLEAIKKMFFEGVNLQSCNSFGESIVHIVCRRRNDEILEFLSETAKLSFRLQDDFGRTPLHDAAWTDKPNFNMIRRLLQLDPDMLLVRDKRGNLPLAYIPRSNWTQWCDFFDKNTDLIQKATSS